MCVRRDRERTEYLRVETPGGTFHVYYDSVLVRVSLLLCTTRPCFVITIIAATNAAVTYNDHVEVDSNS